MIRPLVLFLAAVFALGARGSAHAADDFGPGFQFYEHQAAIVLRAAGTKCWEAADDAVRQGFHAFAEEQAFRAIDFDPEQREAREYLKFEKKEGKWVQNEEEWKNKNHGNTKNEKESQDGYDKRIKKWQDETLVKTDKYVAAKYAELGDICAQKGHPDQAVKGYESAMRLDKDNEKARKGLGYTKFGKVWLTKKQDEARKAASKAEVVKETETTVWEDALGVKFNKVQSAHVRIETPFPVEEAVGHCQAAETLYAYYLADFGKSPDEDVFSGGKATFIVMNTEEQWNKFVDKFGGEQKEFVRAMSGLGVGNLAEGIRGSAPTKQKGDMKEIPAGSSIEGRRDQLCHRLTHEMNEHVWRLSDKAWLNEGLAYYYTLKVLESCSTHCVALKKGDYANNRDEGGYKKWDDPNGWKPLLKALVKKKNDTPLRGITMLPLTKLDYIDTVKAWSVASWLMDLDRAKFTSVLDQMLDRAVKQENVIQGEYGKGYEDIDEDWHKYVKKNY
jgi:tetratricopeptide (TPR) repeat protein